MGFLTEASNTCSVNPVAAVLDEIPSCHSFRGEKHLELVHKDVNIPYLDGQIEVEKTRRRCGRQAAHHTTTTSRWWMRTTAFRIS